MLLENLHPLDRQKLRTIAEGLFDVSAGRAGADTGLLATLEALMANMAPLCVPEDAAKVLCRLHAIADHRLGAADIADLVVIEITVARPNL